MPVRRVTEGVYQLRQGRINAWLVVREATAVLVDSGLPAQGPGILRMVEQVGVHPRLVSAVLLTHSHLDHAGSASFLAEECQAGVTIHGADAAPVEGLARLSPTRGVLGLAVEPFVALLDRRVFSFRPCAVTPVADGWKGWGLKLIHLPGHTPGHSCYFHSATGVAFCGDAAVNWGVGLSGPSKLFSSDLEQVRLSQLRLAELEARWYCFGHGPPLRGGARSLRQLAAG